jgi:hypothetical protein
MSCGYGVNKEWLGKPCNSLDEISKAGRDVAERLTAQLDGCENKVQPKP